MSINPSSNEDIVAQLKSQFEEFINEDIIAQLKSQIEEFINEVKSEVKSVRSFDDSIKLISKVFHNHSDLITGAIVPNISLFHPVRLNSYFIFEILFQLFAPSTAILTSGYKFLSENISIDFTNPSVKKIQNFTLPFLSIIGSSCGIFKLSKLNKNFLFHSYISSLNRDIGDFFIFEDSNNSRLTIIKACNQITDSFDENIRKKSNYVYSLAYYVSYMATAYFTMNPFLCGSLPTAVANSARILSQHYMVSCSSNIDSLRGAISKLV